MNLQYRALGLCAATSLEIAFWKVQAGQLWISHEVQRAESWWSSSCIIFHYLTNPHDLDSPLLLKSGSQDCCLQSGFFFLVLGKNIGGGWHYKIQHISGLSDLQSGLETIGWRCIVPPKARHLSLSFTGTLALQIKDDLIRIACSYRFMLPLALV